MFKSIVTMLVFWVTLTSYGFAISTPTTESRTGWSGLANASSTTRTETDTKRNKKPIHKPVMIRWTAGEWGIGNLKTMHVTPAATTQPSVDTSSEPEVTMIDVIKVEVVQENTEEPMPTEGVGITEAYPNTWLAHTGAKERNVFYLLISLFGMIGMAFLFGTAREEA